MSTTRSKMPPTLEGKQQKTTKEEAVDGGSQGLLDKMEAITWLFCTMVFFTWYNPIGELSKASWDAKSPGLLQWVDDELRWMDDVVPYVPQMVIPYIFVYGMPHMYLASLCYTRGLDMAKVRRFFITQMVLIASAFSIYLLSPTRTDLLHDSVTGRAALQDDSWTSKLCIKFVHQGISLFVASPSMHTAHAFAIAAAFSADKLKGTWLMWALAFCTLFSTCSTKAHTPPHLFFGLLLWYVIQHCVFDNLDRVNVTLPKMGFWMRFYAIAAAPMAFILVGEELHKASGWVTDIPAMFGFEANPVLGLYGFHP